ncbi:hypothetical protein AG1IA_09702 [Rhizoctonia solani AG-1 IA]|uniref:Uncharacterized protein n=1 Tax=Thanatephorus cucumeris (strain AG1-IA) TaxID=983506 RepID=L8WIV7_THACA|nr:hypothetical protein AG1IA_09702 [Rhizoctonia solani AG-1 IA]
MQGTIEHSAAVASIVPLPFTKNPAGLAVSTVRLHVGPWQLSVSGHRCARAQLDECATPAMTSDPYLHDVCIRTSNRELAQVVIMNKISDMQICPSDMKFLHVHQAITVLMPRCNEEESSYTRMYVFRVDTLSSTLQRDQMCKYIQVGLLPRVSP